MLESTDSELFYFGKLEGKGIGTLFNQVSLISGLFASPTDNITPAAIWATM